MFTGICRNKTACDTVPLSEYDQVEFDNSKPPNCGTFGCVYELTQPSDKVIKVFNQRKNYSTNSPMTICQKEAEENNAIQRVIGDKISATDLTRQLSYCKTVIENSERKYPADVIGFPYLLKKKCIPLKDITDKELLYSLLDKDNIRTMLLLLKTLHNKDIYLLDIKPGNMVVCNNRLCFTDFGGAKYMYDINPEEPFGTSGYISPEILHFYGFEYIFDTNDDILTYLYNELIADKDIYLIQPNNTALKLNKAIMRSTLNNFLVLPIELTKSFSLNRRWLKAFLNKNDLFAFGLSLGYIKWKLNGAVPPYITDIINLTVFNYTGTEHVEIRGYNKPNDVVTCEKVLRLL